MKLSFLASNDLFKTDNSDGMAEKVMKYAINKDTIMLPMTLFGVFIVNVEHISHLFSSFTVDFEQLVSC